MNESYNFGERTGNNVLTLDNISITRMYNYKQNDITKYVNVTIYVLLSHSNDCMSTSYSHMVCIYSSSARAFTNSKGMRIHNTIHVSAIYITCVLHVKRSFNKLFIFLSDELMIEQYIVYCSSIWVYSTAV